jgi:hypothetical protein
LVSGVTGPRLVDLNNCQTKLQIHAGAAGEEGTVWIVRT